MGRAPQTGTKAAEDLSGRLRSCVAEAVGRARERGAPVLASASVVLEQELDVAASVFASRLAEDRYFIWEQPDRDSFALGAIGAAVSVETGGDGRFSDASAGCCELIQSAVIDWMPAGDRGPLWVGGFAFDAAGGATPPWGAFPSALFVLPELLLRREDGLLTATASVLCRGADHPDALTAAALTRLEGLRSDPIPLVDPDPVAGYAIASTLPPHSYEQAVQRAVEQIRSGRLDKIVLAREVTVEAPSPFKIAAVFDGLRQSYPSCYSYCVGGADGAFVGASPELLLRREGARLSTVALAGSARRSADPSVDDHLGERLLHSAKDLEEHRIVAREIARSLEPLSVWVTAADEPVLAKIANIQHLATPIRAQLAEPLSAIELAGRLHPTPAVGGEPWSIARPLIERLEQMERGWYAAPIGWMDATEDGEFCVALRCALIEGRVAHCYAGVGVVADSDPEAELAETEVKLQALMAVLTGA